MDTTGKSFRKLDLFYNINILNESIKGNRYWPKGYSAGKRTRQNVSLVVQS